ncbi:MAG: hypothetical protein NVS4B9_10760 [Ktedonobacteraceae bacterium]
MTTITDDFMQQMLAASKDYTIVILRVVPGKDQTEVKKIVWEHGRRNFVLRAAGLLPIICRVTDDSDVAGIGIFNASVEEVKKIMDEDPGVRAGVFIYEVHPSRSFPGDCLPGA